MPYRIVFMPGVRKQVEPLSQRLKERLRQRISALASDPHGPGTKPLTAQLRGLHRLRVGDMRVVYQIEEEESIVRIVRIANRRDAYEQLERMTR